MDDVHVVKDQPDEDIPVYVVYPESSPKKERTLHRDLLLPCGYLPLKERSVAKRSPSAQQQEQESPVDELSDTEEEYEEVILHVDDDNTASSENSSEEVDDSGSSDSSEELPRRSGRIRRPPDRLQYSHLGGSG